MSKQDKMLDIQLELDFEKEKKDEMVDQPTSKKKQERFRQKQDSLNEKRELT